MKLCIYEKNENGLTHSEIQQAVMTSLEELTPKNVLLIPPDFTRFHSNTGFITNCYYHALKSRGCEVDILPALGSHMPVTREEADIMFGDIPYEEFIVHDWRNDVVKLGEIPQDFLEDVTDGHWHEPISVEINRLVMDEKYDLIISLGQVVPHEVIGMASHAKNLFVGVGGSDMINKSHMVASACNSELMMGKDHTPVRKIFDYGMEHYLNNRPILFVMTVGTTHEGNICTHGLFIGNTRSAFEAAIDLAQKKNISFVETGIKKCVVYLDPTEFKTTWLGNKAIYRTRMAMADGGNLIILAPGVEQFGEDKKIDELIRKYGYSGKNEIEKQLKKSSNSDIRNNMGAAAHLIAGSANGSFTITYAVKKISKDEIQSVGYEAADYDDLSAKYDPEKLQYGYNTLSDGEEVYFIPNPALGLWMNRETF